ncbi:NAD+ synthase [Jiella sp. MQZ9-1]|uniref:Glutamine-dependent NAD(+) synthetase n=1 Tax=Jiella flava TaxID=2816857 RepID=A0A939FWK3_9HYPH|nr:NAD+ synthase [Jiella flava]MBO0661495.1 NAD+ synthase [Jiella flava]MCD2470137.1 NAD+ synthase [Jiella flava]
MPAMPAITDRFRLAVAQLNPTVGDVAGNLERARKARAEAAEAGADLILFTELFLAGYPPEDLVLKPAFVAACMAAVETFAKETADGGPGVVIGCPLSTEAGLFNAVAVLDGGAVVTWRSKVDLPNYGEFDEKRVFQAGEMPGPVNFRGLRLGIPVCEDIWGDLGICETLAESGAELLIVPNGSPFYRGKLDVRHQMVLRQVIETDLPMVYANQLGGQDELVFDGASFAFNADRSLAFQYPQFQAGVFVCDWVKGAAGWQAAGGTVAEIPDDDAAVWQACVLGLGDYVNKNGFKSVILGLSGGIDSAVCAAMAVDALGAERVHTVMLPYRYTAETSLEDAAACAKTLGIRYDIVPIAEPVEGFLSALAPMFAGSGAGITEENLQSRTRGTILMAISNKFGAMVVTTGNKSEMSVGYATLYGDMNGGFNPIKDLYKTEVFRLARWRNQNHRAALRGPEGAVVPERIITKPPSAELRADQKDEDSLPPYDTLDAILRHLVEADGGVDDLVAEGFDRDTVAHIEKLLYIAEYKRRQSAPGVKVTRKNFGRDRRYPITNRFREG